MPEYLADLKRIAPRIILYFNLDYTSVVSIAGLVSLADHCARMISAEFIAKAKNLEPLDNTCS